MADNDLLVLSFALHSFYGNSTVLCMGMCGDYQATDVGSWSCVGSNVPVRNESR